MVLKGSTEELKLKTLKRLLKKDSVFMVPKIFNTLIVVKSIHIKISILNIVIAWHLKMGRVIQGVVSLPK